MVSATHLVDLASVRLGAAVLFANDEFFAPKERLLDPKPPVFVPDKYTDRGKWMDGWETRRRRTPGHDWCIVRLGLAGIVRTVIVDTAHFRGNFPSHCSLEGCGAAGDADVAALTSDAVRWHSLLPQSELRGDAENAFSIENRRRFTHVRLNILPDGGVARLRIFGESLPDWIGVLGTGEPIDLASVVHGGHVVDTSDRFFGEPRNMLMPYPAETMADGWETKRRRTPGHDWAIVRLGIESIITRVEIDTTYFKGNYPDACSAEGAVLEEDSRGVSADVLSHAGADWRPVLGRTQLAPDQKHVFVDEIARDVKATHVRLNIYPDGGISRFRVFGLPTGEGRRISVLRVLNAMDEWELRASLADFCAAPAWTARMTAARPFTAAGSVLAAADAAAGALAPDDWLEAFRHHPRIGERVAQRSQSEVARAWSAREQSAASQASTSELAALEEANRDYERRFGYVFIVAAAGRTVHDIIENLRARLNNDPATELKAAAAEQRRITRLRLENLLG